MKAATVCPNTYTVPRNCRRLQHSIPTPPIPLIGLSVEKRDREIDFIIGRLLSLSPGGRRAEASDYGLGSVKIWLSLWGLSLLCTILEAGVLYPPL